MRLIIAGQTAADEDECAELALGVDEQLFAGVAGEGEIEREARMDAAHAMLADLRREDPELAASAAVGAGAVAAPGGRPPHGERRPGGGVNAGVFAALAAAVSALTGRSQRPVRGPR
ncbi:hypothetical protein [Kitasatospora purpeofusca]|uniref:hypothetical protein n=1 Tax=Kitasatospora purpeofusca TaxID=67352 RepID=UPI00068E44AD|nr:hypothetical protein [Kitasatospora purpeofusca]